MSQPHRVLSFALAPLLTLVSAVESVALRPEEIAVVAARANRESLGLAKYYCEQRGVPLEQIIEVDLPPGETLDREQWRWSVRPEIRKWLEEKDPDRNLRCLVTTWGVPLRIDKGKRQDDGKRRLVFLRGERDARREQLRQVASALDRLGGGARVGETFEVAPDDEPLDEMLSRLEASLRAAQTRLATLSNEARRADEARIQQLAAVAGGSRVLLQGINQRLQALQQVGEEPPAAIVERFHVLRGRAMAYNEVRLLLDSWPPNVDRDAFALRAIEQTGGLIASVTWLDKQIDAAARRESGAAFDSELSLVLWPDGYELVRWQPNFLRASFRGSQLGEAFPTLMVARIDGPDLPTAKRLIDDAIAVEQQGGLVGKVYLDARGLTTLEGPAHEPGSYPDYDRSLLATAKGLEGLEDAAGEPRFDVILNEQPELFSPGQCPEAALYCGWYSLAKYVDAFEWNRGAVAYHMASAEATTLKEIDSQAWCRKLLQDGVCATIGPVYEPYLVAFPRPNEFFAVLVAGESSLAEAYYQTKPFNSWMMTLIGDPLYRPYASVEAAD